jgi:hypothetical protein
MTGDKLRRQETDGSMGTLAEQRANEIVVDGGGNIYLNGADFNFSGGEAPSPATSSSLRQTASYARSRSRQHSRRRPANPSVPVGHTRP